MLSTVACVFHKVKQFTIEIYARTKGVVCERVQYGREISLTPWLHLNVDVWTAKTSTGKDKYICEHAHEECNTNINIYF